MNRVGFLKPGRYTNCQLPILVLVLRSATHVVAQSAPTPSDQLGNSQIKVSPTMAIILICLITAFFLMGFISVYIRQCTERGVSLTDADGIFGGSRSARGLDPAVIETFPTFFYSDVKGHKLGQTALECAVCLLEFEDDEVLRLLPKCSHVFHPDCIDAWLAFRVTCPVCRANLVPVDGELNHVISCSDFENDVIELHAPPANHGSASPAGEFTNDIESPEVISTGQSPNQNLPPKPTPRRSRNNRKFPRSHSTGHLVLQPGENTERFTLRLPEDFRSQLVNASGLKRSNSVVAFPRARSSTKGFRSTSVGTGGGKNYENYERVSVRSGWWNFRRTPPFISRAGSTRSLSEFGEENLTATPTTWMTSIKSPLNRLLRGTDKDNVGERPTDRLRPDHHG